MFKLFVSILLLGFGLQANAEVITDEARLQSYKDATILLLEGKGCDPGAGIWFAGSLINYARRVTVSDDNSQPLLTFEAAITYGPATRATVAVTTSPDFTTVVGAQIVTYIYTKVNKGDLKNPQIVEEYVPSGSCTVKL